MPRIFEDIEELRSLVGQEVAASDWLEVDQARIDRFADATGDHQWIHQDVERASRESPYGRTIAHGFLTLSLISQLTASAMEIRGAFKMKINYGLNRVRFPAPAPSGARIRARFALQAMEDIPRGVQLTWDITVDVEGSGKPALAAEWLVRFYR